MSSMKSASRFLLLGEPLSLDLANTCIHRNGAAVDLLDSPAALGAWLHAEANRLHWTGPANAADWHAVRALRTALLGELAADAVALLTGPRATQLRKCANPDCILQFVADNPRRRWCSSAVCGNRARVARHYQRHHGAG